MIAGPLASDAVLSSGPPPLVLLVDGHHDTRDMYRMWLERGGLRVVDAASADEALVLVDLLGPRVVATEMGFPVMDGYELCRRLRRQPETHRIPNNAVTSRVMRNEIERAWDAGCDAVLPKPCAPETLLVEIVRLLRLPPAPVARPA